VPDKGLDKVFVFRLDTARGTLVPGTPPLSPAEPALRPVTRTFTRRSRTSTSVNELDSTIATYRLDATSGALTPRQVITTLPSSYTGNNSGAEIVVAPSGRFVYASNRGHDSIAIFAVDQSTGVLTRSGGSRPRGRTPRFFALDPSGTHLYAANQGSDTVVIFRVDQTSGTLASTGETIKVATPTTIAFR
jgi:6-phosphogluconolactonase (cycloisomerase 2 family)